MAAITYGFLSRCFVYTYWYLCIFLHIYDRLCACAVCPIGVTAERRRVQFEKNFSKKLARVFIVFWLLCMCVSLYILFFYFYANICIFNCLMFYLITWPFKDALHVELSLYSVRPSIVQKTLLKICLRSAANNGGPSAPLVEISKNYASLIPQKHKFSTKKLFLPNKWKIRKNVIFWNPKFVFRVGDFFRWGHRIMPATSE